MNISLHRRIRFVLLLLSSFLFTAAVSFRLQSYFFARRVHAILNQMEKIQLDKTNEQEVHSLLPELKPGIPWSFRHSGQTDENCPGDACYVLRLKNWPDEQLAKLREKLEYRDVWIFKAVYWLGHRYLSFAAYVEIRKGVVSRCEYALSVEDSEYPANEIVGVEVLGANRAGFPGYFGFMRDYDEIGGFRIRVPSNKNTTIMYVAFTPDARSQDVESAFDVHLECAWNINGCSATSQILPSLWKPKVGQKTQQ